MSGGVFPLWPDTVLLPETLLYPGGIWIDGLVEFVVPLTSDLDDGDPPFQGGIDVAARSTTGSIPDRVTSGSIPARVTSGSIPARVTSGSIPSRTTSVVV